MFLPESERLLRLLLPALCLAQAALFAQQPADADSFKESVRPFLAQHCVACHNAQAPAGNLDIQSLYAVREIERRIEAAETSFKPTIAKPSGIPVLFADHAKLMYDLQIMAFQADLTRVSTMVIGREGSVRTYPEIGVSDPHHPLTHHRNIPEQMERVTKVNELHASLFAYYLDKLKSTPDGDGSLLDHSIALYGSGLSDGNRHLHEDLPILIAGKGNGRPNTGRHIVLGEQTPIANLYLTMLDHAGAPQERFGDQRQPAPRNRVVTAEPTGSPRR